MREEAGAGSLGARKTMSQFVFAYFTIHNRAEYDRYVELAKPIFIREGVKVHANDEVPVPMTPNIKADKAVLLEFRDSLHMKTFFALPDYMEAAKHRDAGTIMSIIRFKRFDEHTAV